VGMRSDRHITDTLCVGGLSLDEPDRRRLDAWLDAHPGPRGDTYELEREKGGRHASILRTDLNKG